MLCKSQIFSGKLSHLLIHNLFILCNIFYYLPGEFLAFTYVVALHQNDCNYYFFDKLGWKLLFKYHQTCFCISSDILDFLLKYDTFTEFGCLCCSITSGTCGLTEEKLIKYVFILHQKLFWAVLVFLIIFNYGFLYHGEENVVLLLW